jgi:hypothetical protein
MFYLSNFEYLLGKYVFIIYNNNNNHNLLDKLYSSLVKDFLATPLPSLIHYVKLISGFQSLECARCMI